MVHNIPTAEQAAISYIAECQKKIDFLHSIYVKCRNDNWQSVVDAYMNKMDVYLAKLNTILHESK